MVVKLADTPSHVADLAEVFHALRRHRMRLNPDKCLFGVSGDKFLGFMLSSRGIEANPDKCQAIIDIGSPSNLKEVQKLAGRLTALSRFLPYAERRYQLLEKVALGLIYAARRLRQYFQSHIVVVRTDCPIAKVLRKQELVDRMMAWSIELSEFDIRFEPRGAIKSQSLADFINELSPLGRFEDSTWTMHVDGSSNDQGSGAGLILESPSGITLEQSLRFGFRASNNQAEYEALLAGMRLAAEMGVTKITCWTDSKISNQFQEIQVKHTPRGSNERADQLARLASSRKPGQLRSTIHLELQDCMPVDGAPKSWMTDILNFIVNGSEPTDPIESRKLRTQAVRYEIHEGICGSHSGGRTLATKVLRAGYYWPTLKSDCTEFVKKCVQFQKHGTLIHSSTFNTFLESLAIRHRFTSVEHPQSNGQAEAANKVILTELKKRLGSAKGAWAEKLPEVL
uniref:Integrase catalytic domain-containing protein n=1 Tax=Cajanus cajan TaxID=3821 RepID=A0A151T5P0_CAJCA|nr:hypothetical protein KK1_016872 [Cajanus cajan]